MRIGVEIIMFSAPRAGIARYVANMLGWMMTQAPDAEYVLYSPKPIDVALPPGRWSLRAEGDWRGVAANYWVQSVLPHLLAKDRIDVFWGQNHLLPLRGAPRCRRLLTVHDLTAVLFPGTMPPKSRLGAALLFRKAVLRSDHVIAVSQATARSLAVHFGVGGRRMSVVRPGCDAAFHPAGRERTGDATAARLELPDRYVLTVGTIEPRKNHLLLLRALALLPSPPEWVVVGRPGWRCGYIMSELRAASERGLVRFLDSVDDRDLRTLYCRAQALVLPSLYEGFGSPVVEAMACGCPVLCSWTSSLPEVGGRTARYFRSGDTSDLAEKLTALLASPAELRRMAADGPAQAARFSYQRAAGQVLALMRALVRPGRGPRSGRERRG